MERIKLSLIRTDGGTQSRKALMQDLVTQYAQNMKEGDVFPAVTLFHDGSDYWLADGFHRYFATKANGGLDIEADIKEGTARDAKLYAIGANTRHGKLPTREEIKASIILMLEDEEWGLWSLREIARHIGVSHTTVARVKEELERPEEEPKEALPKVDKGSKKEPAVTPVTDPVPHDDRLDELAETVNSLAEENALLKDKIAIGQWDASEIEKIDIEDTVKELREKIRVLEIENAALRDSRDMFQNRNAELLKQVKSLQAKLKKLGAE